MMDRAIDSDVASSDRPVLLEELHCFDLHRPNAISLFARDPPRHPVADFGLILLASHEKRIHPFEELRHSTEGWLSAPRNM